MDGQFGVIGLPAVNPAELGLRNVLGAVQTQPQDMAVKAVRGHQDKNRSATISPVPVRNSVFCCFLGGEGGGLIVNGNS